MLENSLMAKILFFHEKRFLRFDFDDFILLNVYWPNGGMGEEGLPSTIWQFDFHKKGIDELVLLTLKNWKK